MATDDHAARSSGWARVAIVRGVVLIGTGLVALFRPDEAGAVLGAALVAASILELAMPAAAGNATEVARRGRRRYLQVLAGSVAGLALTASSIGRVGLEAQVVALTGPGSPPDPAALQSALDVALAGPVQLDLRISQTVLYTTPGQGPGPSGNPGPSTSPTP